MDYSCAKFGDCTFSRLILSRGQTHTHRNTDAANRPTHATVVGASNDYSFPYCVCGVHF